MDLTQEFIQERLYLKGVSTETVRWYGCSFKAFKDAMDSKAEVVKRIGELKGRGISHITINSYLRVVNAYNMWLHKEHGKELLRIPKLKEEQKILNTFSKEHVQRLIHFKPKGKNQTRAHIVSLLLLDTGLRISEALGLTKEDVDLEHFTIKAYGKGAKYRLVPFSVELRKALFRHLRHCTTRLIFGTRNDTKLTVRNFHRDFKELGQKAGIVGVRISPHTCRHTFAVSYLRAGGNLFYLSKILGHTSLKTTERYLQSLGIEDLQKVHNGLSVLTGGGRF